MTNLYRRIVRRWVVGLAAAAALAVLAAPPLNGLAAEDLPLEELEREAANLEREENRMEMLLAELVKEEEQLREEEQSVALQVAPHLCGFGRGRS